MYALLSFNMPVKVTDILVIALLLGVTISMAYLSTPTQVQDNSVPTTRAQLPVLAEGQFSNFSQAFLELGTVVKGLPLNELNSGIAGALFSQFSSKLGSTYVTVIYNTTQRAVEGKIVVSTSPGFGETFKEIQSGLVLFANFTSNFTTTFGVLDNYGLAFQYLPGSSHMCISLYKGPEILVSGALSSLSLPLVTTYNETVSPKLTGLESTGILFVNTSSLEELGVTPTVNVTGSYWVITYEPYNASVVITQGNVSSLLSGYSPVGEEGGYQVFASSSYEASFTTIQSGLWKGDNAVFFVSKGFPDLPQVMKEIGSGTVL